MGGCHLGWEADQVGGAGADHFDHFGRDGVRGGRVELGRLHAALQDGVGLGPEACMGVLSLGSVWVGVCQGEERLISDQTVKEDVDRSNNYQHRSLLESHYLAQWHR